MIGRLSGGVVGVGVNHMTTRNRALFVGKPTAHLGHGLG